MIELIIIGILIFIIICLCFYNINLNDKLTIEKDENYFKDKMINIQESFISDLKQFNNEIKDICMETTQELTEAKQDYYELTKFVKDNFNKFKEEHKSSLSKKLITLWNKYIQKKEN